MNAANLFAEDEIYEIQDVGYYLDFANDWDSLLQQMGPAAAFWPNPAVQLPKSVRKSNGTNLSHLQCHSKYLLLSRV